MCCVVPPAQGTLASSYFLPAPWGPRIPGGLPTLILAYAEALIIGHVQFPFRFWISDPKVL